MADHKPRWSQLFSATQRPKRERKSLKEGGGSEAGSDLSSALTAIEQQSKSHAAIKSLPQLPHALITIVVNSCSPPHGSTHA
jgi:hypothetical protein